jgi:glycosyltransferase involved in cell wall biosynthesis
VIGQGIDTMLFDLRPTAEVQRDVITVGRVSPRKRLELQIEVLAVLLRKTSTPFQLKIIGPTMNSGDEEYLRRLRLLAEERGVAEQVSFVGRLPIDEIPAHYATAFVHLNVSQTGSMDKTVLEALASGCPVLTSNEAYRGTLQPYPEYIIHDQRPEAIADQVLSIYAARAHLDRAALRGLVLGTHDLQSYALRIVEQLHSVRDEA